MSIEGTVYTEEFMEGLNQYLRYVRNSVEFWTEDVGDNHQYVTVNYSADSRSKKTYLKGLEINVYPTPDFIKGTVVEDFGLPISLKCIGYGHTASVHVNMKGCPVDKAVVASPVCTSVMRYWDEKFRSKFKEEYI